MYIENEYENKLSSYKEILTEDRSLPWQNLNRARENKGTVPLFSLEPS